MFDIQENLRNLPDLPGVYLHKDRDGQILYVGKARSLKKRVRQYFQSTRGQDPKVRALVSHIVEFEYIVTQTEMEALLLESSLIKRHMPKYNVLLRDDKTFPYIKVTLQEPWPRLLKTRRVNDDGARYFGPYTDAAAVNELIELLSGLYRLKRCSPVAFPPDWRPCLNHHLGLCSGACAGLSDAADYAASIRAVVSFLEGDTAGVEEELTRRMDEASEAMEYELAALYRDRLRTVREIPDQERLDEFLTDVRRNKVKVVRRRAEALAEKEQTRQRELSASWQRLGFSHIPRTEAYDISHIAGTDAVGAMAAFQDGKPLRSQYRRFRIKAARGGDDPTSVREVLRRRLLRGLAGDPGFVPLPELILVDGGESQVRAAEETAAELSLAIPVGGMVKDAKHRTRGLLFDGREIRRHDDPTLLRHLGAVQEEVHRFAVEYLRGIRSKGMKRSVLDGIHGIGPVRKQGLFSRFGSVEAMRDATVEELAGAPGMDRKTAETLQKHLQVSIVKPAD